MEDEGNKLIKPLMVSFLGQMDSVMKVSNVISEHSDETELSPDSLISGLVYRLMTPMTDNELRESMDAAEEILNKSSSESDSDCDSEEYQAKDIGTQDHQDKVIVSRIVKRNTCNCDLCINVRVCLSNYSKYEVKDKLAQTFKDAIDNACNIHNISI